jgi:putative ABC transport system substrate-binding protein
MRRREFITTIAVGATAWSLAARAQQPKRVPQIGFLTTGSLESAEMRTGLNAFIQGLREHGYIDGQNIFVEVRAANSEVEQFPALANELIGLNVDLIVATNSLAARAVQRATTTIPVVVPVMGDPVGDGLVSSLARPWGEHHGVNLPWPTACPQALGPAEGGATHGFAGGRALASRRLRRTHDE